MLKNPLSWLMNRLGMDENGNIVNQKPVAWVEYIKPTPASIDFTEVSENTFGDVLDIISTSDKWQSFFAGNILTMGTPPISDRVFWSVADGMWIGKHKRYFGKGYIIGQPNANQYHIRLDGYPDSCRVFYANEIEVID